MRDPVSTAAGALRAVAPDGLHAGPHMRAVFMTNRWLMQTTAPAFAGFEHVPAHGPVLLVPNHVSLADPFVIGRFAHQARRLPRYLAKASLFETPVIGEVLSGAEQIRVHRAGPAAAQAVDAAVVALTDAQCVVMYPEGTVTKDPDLWPMRARTGIARLALATGAPVVPVAQWGAQHLLPGGSSPFGLRPWRRVPVTVRALPPVDLSAHRPPPGEEPTVEALRDATATIMGALTAGVARLRGEEPPPGVWDPATGRREETA